MSQDSPTTRLRPKQYFVSVCAYWIRGTLYIGVVLVAMYMMPADWRWMAAGFVIYRTFDIWKPWPIHYAEERLGLGSGIMTDAVIAGLCTLAILQIARVMIGRYV